MKDLGILIAGGHHTLLNQIDNYEETVTQARAKVDGIVSKSAWKDKIQQAKNIIADLPQEIMFDEPEAFLHALLEIEEQITKRKNVLKNMKDSV